MVGLGYGEVAMNCMHLFLTGCKVGQPVSQQHNGMTNSEMEILEERRCGRQPEICSLEEKERSSGSALCRNSQSRTKRKTR